MSFFRWFRWALLGGPLSGVPIPDAEQSTFSLSDFEVAADGETLTTANVDVYDASGNPLASAPVVLSSAVIEYGDLTVTVSLDRATMDSDGVESCGVSIQVRDPYGSLNKPVVGIPASYFTIAVDGSGNTITQPASATNGFGTTSGSFVTTEGSVTKTVTVAINGTTYGNAPTVETDGVPVAPIWSDDFETGDLTHTENDVAWQTPDGNDAIAGTGADGSFTRTSGTWTANSQIGATFYFQTTSGNAQGGFVNVIGPFVVTSNTTTVLSFTGDATGAVQTRTRRAVVTDAAARSGTYSLGYIFGPDLDGLDSRSQSGFNLSSDGLGELWLEYYLYVPANYVHRSQSPANNKFFSLFQRNQSSDASRILFDFETDNNGGEGSDLFAQSVLSTATATDATHVTGDTGYPGTDIIGEAGSPMVLGDWNRIRIHLKAATGASAADGEQELWINTTKVFQATGRQFGYPNIPGSLWYGTFPAVVDNCYLLGASNSGFEELTIFYVDDIALYDTDPGWG